MIKRSNNIKAFLFAVIIFYGCGNQPKTTAVNNKPSDSIIAQHKGDTTGKITVTGKDSLAGNEFLNTVLKGGNISYSFLQKHTLIDGYPSDSDVAAAIRADSGNENLSGEALDHFAGNSVHRLNKRFVIAIIDYLEDGVCSHQLLFIIDMVTHENTDWIEGGYSCDSDNGYNGSREFKFKNDSVLVITEHTVYVDS
ncbi:MAG TPA: hypothetical protein VK809_09755, partial [Bacteroidia bacterium]|nr:hypothetical protein [Bacteroidia bacterium]